ncbi:hypothetical protein LR48_Vigan10g029200 [Vigna angularis]|uniref:Uncharacterized protein n=1 Tax=Phaseolus angularis TaxID=3914 RepID=A0A0L9VH52_PHAAN|nr:hypothetical protein LR48_Vigan10g029200 [Vigna angularis]
MDNHPKKLGEPMEANESKKRRKYVFSGLKLPKLSSVLDTLLCIVDIAPDLYTLSSPSCAYFALPPLASFPFGRPSELETPYTLTKPPLNLSSNTWCALENSFILPFRCSILMCVVALE